MQKFAVFDIDGTLIRWQLYHTVVDRLAKSGSLGSGAYEEIKNARMKWKKRDNAESYRQYEKVIIKVFESALADISTDEFDKIGSEAIAEYKDQVYTYTRDLIKQLKAKNYFILAISGSHHELVELIADYYGFDDCIGSNYFRSGKVFTGDKNIPSLDKGKQLNKMVAKHNLSFADSYGVGDSQGDIAMLNLVENPIAFNPDQKLYKKAIESNWQIVVERKDVIYELANSNGSYNLKI